MRRKMRLTHFGCWSHRPRDCQSPLAIRLPFSFYALVISSASD